jgi:pyruvate/2-oxoglutarate dehydrogenase complex dihydrolipoamide acyltransferase (E2) component
MKDAPYSIEPFDPFRQLVIDGMDLAARKHHIHGLVEVDVTKARERIRKIKERTGERLSFTGFVVYCCAKAVDEDKHLHA